MRIQQDESTPSTHPTFVGSLPPTVSVTTAAKLFGVSRAAAYRAASDRVAGDEFRWPTPVIKVGRSVRIPTTALLAALGMDPEEVEQALLLAGHDPTGPAVAA